MNRRHFINSSALIASTFLIDLDAFAAPLLKNIGIQLFSLPKLLEKDFKMGIQLLAKMGYREIEMYGPFPFSTKLAMERWVSIGPALGFNGSGYFGQSAEAVKAIFAEAKISVPSIHTDFDTLQKNMEQLGEASQRIGFKYVVLPAIPPENRKTLDDYKKTIDTFNKIGEQAKKVGLRFAYHNHGYGMQEVEGKIPLQMIIENTDPKLVALEMDLFWHIAGGGDPVEYFKKYPGRYKMMHVKNMKKKVKFSTDGGDSKEWIELFPFMTTTGDGVLDLKSIIAAAQKSGMDHFFVEQDVVADPEINLKKSIDYLKTL
ncbi:MAG TPA: TIM barrel protein [Cyclobacteriaceae bacterium]|nr:TIM barrel protein [Cyclobacteriaceae bacterium]